MKSGGTAISSVLVSVPWTWNFGDPPAGLDGVEMRVLRRSSDWGLSKFRARLRMFTDAVAIACKAPDCDVVVMATAGVEAALGAALIKARSRATRVIVFDFLAPRSKPPARWARLLSRTVDRFLIIRSGDVAMLKRRFGIRNDRCYFLPWPVRADQVPSSVSEDGYVYSAGWAHRDWPTLIAALDQAGLMAKLAPGRDVTVPERSRQRIEVLDMPSPEIGRQLAAKANVIAVAMEDTDLPSGPLVLLDSMAMGKAVVVTNVNGSRDYVRDGETGLVVPPGDSLALASALRRLSDDADLRARLGAAARTETLERCSLERFWKELADQCR